MRRLVVLVLICTVAFSLLPVSYARVSGGWGDGCHAQPLCSPSRPTCRVEFTRVHAWDNEQESVEPKEVGDIQAQIVDEGQRIVVAITNAYPHYIGYVRFKIVNLGDLPLEITEVTIDNPNADALDVRVSKSRLMWGVMEPGGSRCGLLKTELQQVAAMNATYSFTVNIHVEQWNGGGPCP